MRGNEKVYMLELLLPQIPGLLSQGWDDLHKAVEFKRFREAVVDRLGRELRLNLELWGLSQGRLEKDVDWSRLVTSSAFDELFQLPIPIRMVLNESLNEATLEYLRAASVRNSRHASWAQNIKTEVDLAERIWHRMRALTVRQNLGWLPGSVAYLVFLQQAMLMQLKETRGIDE